MKAFPVFNVLETCRVYLLIVDLEIIKFEKPLLAGYKKSSRATLNRRIASGNHPITQFFILKLTLRDQFIAESSTHCY